MANKRSGKMPRLTVEGVYLRAQYLCEGCGVERGENVHHRRFLSRGGHHNFANLVLLCGSGNHTGCHGLAHSGDAPEGWAISRFNRAHECEVPFVDRIGRAWLFSDDGTKERVPEHDYRA